VATLARRLGRPVKWIETRRENLMAASQAREQRVEVDLAANAGGRVQALRARVVSDAGAYHIYPITGILEALGTANILPGPYLTPTYAFEAIALATHKPPLGAYRGVGMTMGAFVMERLLDLLAARVGLDPAEIRRRNLIPREAYPHVSPSGMRYDSGDFPKALEQALAAADYDGLRRGQAAARARGRLVGIGLACYTEYTGMGSEVFRGRGMDDVPGIEAASVRVDPDGSVRCATSFPSQGQGHATTIAQVIADRLGVPLDRVRVEPTDTRSAPLGSGTFGSRVPSPSGDGGHGHRALAAEDPDARRAPAGGVGGRRRARRRPRARARLSAARGHAGRHRTRRIRAPVRVAARHRARARATVSFDPPGRPSPARCMSRWSRSIPTPDASPSRATSWSKTADRW